MCARQQATLRQHEATIARLHRTRFAEVEEAHVTQRHAEVALTRIGALTLTLTLTVAPTLTLTLTRWPARPELRCGSNPG